MTGKKMTGKQEVTGGFNLDEFVSGSDPAPEMRSEATEQPQKAVTAETRPSLPVEEKKRSKAHSRPRKQPKELTSERVQLMVTPAELEKIREQAGLVSISKFLRKYLQDSGLL
jgi:hypothetical protein